MLVLTTLTKVLDQIAISADIHTAILLSPAGDLISYVTVEPRPKDDIRLLVGVASEAWSESKDDGRGMVNSKLGRIIILPVKQVDDAPAGAAALLLAVNASDHVEWIELERKCRALIQHLAKPLSGLQDKLISPAKTVQRRNERLPR